MVLLLGIASAWAWPAGVDHSIFADARNPGEDKPDIDLPSEGAGEGPHRPDDSRARTIVGASLLGSGIFLCSWGITSWEIEEYQCCPARNTGNVVKIVAGVVLINAGLIYLLEVMD
jgi:hypothetical protein